MAETKSSMLRSAQPTTKRRDVAAADLVTQRLSNFGFRNLQVILRAHEIELDPPLVSTSRPSHTLDLARAYLTHRMEEWQQPLKIYHLTGQEPDQALHVEILGDNTALVDALTIIAFWQVLQSIGLTDQAVVAVNSIGNLESQTAIRRAFTEYYQPLCTHLCGRCQEAFGQNPLLLLRCADASCLPYQSTAPQPIEYLAEESRTHLMLLLEYLDGAGVPYDLSPHLVHEDPYATETIVAIQTRGRKAATLAHGGRYDQLVAHLEGVPTPAFGLSIHLAELLPYLAKSPQLITDHATPRLLIIQLGRRARKKAIPLFVKLSNQGLGVAIALGKESLRGQLRSATTTGAELALIIGEREALDDTVIVRTMHDNTQETYPLDEVETIIESKLAELNES